jgi:protease-4
MTLDDFSGLFGKLGYNSTVIKTGEMKDIGSSSRPITDEERAVLQSIVDESFQEFRSSIEESRGERLNSALFNQALDGRVLSGRQAKRAGLVDQLGSQIDAEELAARLGNITGKPRLCEISLDKRKSMFGSLGAEIEKIVAGASASPPKLSYK